MINKITLVILFSLFITVSVLNSCATAKDTPCPDFTDNKSYSKKYISDPRFEKRYRRFYVRKFQQNGLYTYRQKYRHSNGKDFTINPDRNYK